MQVLYGQADNWAVIHDLRIETGGVVAQIDRLIINRWLDMWVCESKNFSEGVGINEHGEFAAFFGGRPHGIPSPIEQNNRHMLLLSRLFDSNQIKLPTRLGFTLRPALRAPRVACPRAHVSVAPRDQDSGARSHHKERHAARPSMPMLRTHQRCWSLRSSSAETLRNLGMQLTRCTAVKYNLLAKFGLPESSAQPFRSV